MPEPDLSEMHDDACPALDYGLDALESLGTGTDHRVKRALPGLLGRAGQGRVRGVSASRLEFGRQCQCGDRVGGRTVDNDRVRLEPFQNSAGTP